MAARPLIPLFTEKRRSCASPLRYRPWSPSPLPSSCEEEKDQSSTANPVYSFPGRRDHHLGPCLPRVARDGRPAPYPTLHGETSIMRESSSVPALVALTLAFLLRGGKRPIQYGQPGVFIPGETRSSSGALSSPGGPGWPPGPLSHSSRRIVDHARVLFGTGLGRPHPCLPPCSRIGPLRRRQQRGDDHRRRHPSQMHAEGGPILPERPRGPPGGQGGQVLPGKEQGRQRLPPRQRDLLGDKGRADPDHRDRHGQGAGRQEGPDCHQRSKWPSDPTRRVPRGGRECALRGDSRGLGTCPEPQDPSSRHHSPTSYEDHRI